MLLLLQILAFIKVQSNKYKFIPVTLYILALGAKGTALVIPVVLYMLTSRANPLRKRLGEVSPYVAINVVYVLLLLMVNSLSAKKFVTAHNMVSFTNYIRALPVTIIPERYLAESSSVVLAIICSIILVAIIVAVIKLNGITVKIGAAITLFGLLPLLFTRDYVLAGSNAEAMNLLSSPSNRVYLACAGIALVYAVVFEKLTHKDKHLAIRTIAGLLLLTLLCVNYREVYACNVRWNKGTEGFRNDKAMLARNSSMLTNNSVLLLFNTEGSTGFSTAMINTYYDLKNYEVHVINVRYTNELTNVDRSPLSNTKYGYYGSTVKLLMDCPGNPYTSDLVYNGNLILNSIIAGYKELYRMPTAAEHILVTNRLNHDMAGLKNVLNDCLRLQ